MSEHYLLQIDGRPPQALRRRFIDVIDPATEEAIATVECASIEDLHAAVEAASAGFEIWSRMPASKRAGILRRAAKILDSTAEKTARVLTGESGKTLAESRAELARAVQTLQWGADVAEIAHTPRAYPQERGERYVTPQPIGVAALFTPWNYPVVVAARKLVSALAAGCSAILKGSEECPGSVSALVDALFEAGTPRSVVTLLFGVPAEISSFLLDQPEIAILSFTGSTAVGKLLARQAATGLKRCVLELGGHCPVIVCNDVGVAVVAESIAAYKFEHSGQSCNAPSRIYVDRTIYADFVATFSALAQKIVVGNGFDAATTMGPLSSARRIAAVEKLVGDAVSRGAKITCGGTRIGNRGYFYAPTILLNVHMDSAILHEEPFGPLAPVIPFTTVDEAIHLANNTPYGLASYVFTKSPKVAEYVTQQLRAGSVGVNNLQGVSPDAPVGGIGDSGYGYEGGVLGVEAFLNLKLVTAQD